MKVSNFKKMTFFQINQIFLNSVEGVGFSHALMYESEIVGTCLNFESDLNLCKFHFQQKLFGGLLQDISERIDLNYAAVTGLQCTIKCFHMRHVNSAANNHPGQYTLYVAWMLLL